MNMKLLVFAFFVGIISAGKDKVNFDDAKQHIKPQLAGKSCEEMLEIAEALMKSRMNKVRELTGVRIKKPSKEDRNYHLQIVQAVDGGTCEYKLAVYDAFLEYGKAVIEELGIELEPLVTPAPKLRWKDAKDAIAQATKDMPCEQKLEVAAAFAQIDLAKVKELTGVDIHMNDKQQEMKIKKKKYQTQEFEKDIQDFDCEKKLEAYIAFLDKDKKLLKEMGIKLRNKPYKQFKKELDGLFMKKTCEETVSACEALLRFDIEEFEKLAGVEMPEVNQDKIEKYAEMHNKVLEGAKDFDCEKKFTAYALYLNDDKKALKKMGIDLGGEKQKGRDKGKKKNEEEEEDHASLSNWMNQNGMFLAEDEDTEGLVDWLNVLGQ